MTIEVRCSHCGKTLKAPDKFAGRRARCPGCKAAVTIPAAGDLDDVAFEALTGGSAAEKARAEGAKFREQIESQSRPSHSPGELKPALRPLGSSAQPAPLAVAHPKPPARPAATTPLSESPSLWEKPKPAILYWLFALALIPLAGLLLGEEDDAEERMRASIEKLLETRPDIAYRYWRGEELSDEEIFAALPGHKIQGAHLARGSLVHWLYAFLAAGAFFGALCVLFQPGNATPKQTLLVGLCTATLGIVFLLSVQWIANAASGWIVLGHVVFLIFFAIVKFIELSYYAALDPSYGFLASFLGFTFGVGLCEELTKMLPLIFHFRGKSTLDWRGACMWGLASGIGFGVAEGIMYAGSQYNGIATGGIYLVRFISCVALHATWSAAAAIMIFRRKEWFEGDWEWSDLVTSFLWVLAVPMILHGLYNTTLKKEMNSAALLVAAASFAWLIFIVEWTRRQEDAFYNERPRPRLRARPA